MRPWWKPWWTVFKVFGPPITAWVMLAMVLFQAGSSHGYMMGLRMGVKLGLAANGVH